MFTITVARKPLAESTVASNMITQRVGALNIDGTRIGTEIMTESRMHQNPDGTYGKFMLNPNPKVHTGRWPANMVLQHLPECQYMGLKKVPGRHRESNLIPAQSTGAIFTNRKPTQGAGHADENGLEIIPAWECSSECPVADLDEQSGIVPTGSWVRQTDGAHPFGDAKGSGYQQWQEAPKEPPSGASKCFKQLKP